MNLPDFDHLLMLAKDKPDTLEQLRLALVTRVIEQANGETKLRLRGLQFQIDAQRQLHKSPLGACIKISNMMTSSFHEMIAQLNQPNTQNASATAKIYKFETADSH